MKEKVAEGKGGKSRWRKKLVKEKVGGGKSRCKKGWWRKIRWRKK